MEFTFWDWVVLIAWAVGMIEVIWLIFDEASPWGE